MQTQSYIYLRAIFESKNDSLDKKKGALALNLPESLLTFQPQVIEILPHITII